MLNMPLKQKRLAIIWQSGKGRVDRSNTKTGEQRRDATRLNRRLYIRKQNYFFLFVIVIRKKKSIQKSVKVILQIVAVPQYIKKYMYRKRRRI